MKHGRGPTPIADQRPFAARGRQYLDLHGSLLQHANAAGASPISRTPSQVPCPARAAVLVLALPERTATPALSQPACAGPMPGSSAATTLCRPEPLGGNDIVHRDAPTSVMPAHAKPRTGTRYRIRGEHIYNIRVRDTRHRDTRR